MTDERPDHIEPDPTLDRLVLAAANFESEDDTLVDEATLANYLLGAATPEEKARIQSALLRSARLREELVHHLRDMEEVSRPTTAEDSIPLAIPSAPPYAVLQERIRETGPRPIRAEERNRPALVRQMRRPTAEHWWDRLLTPQFGWGLAAAAAIGFAFLMTTHDGIGRLPAVTPTIVSVHGAEVFGPGSRGDVETSARASHLEAAQSALSRCIGWEEDGFQVRDESPKSVPPVRSRSVEVVMVNAQNQVVEKIVGVVPNETPSDATHCWIALLPASGEPEILLQDLKMESNRVRFSWTAELGTTGCAVFTYPTESGFAASGTQFLQLKVVR